jgi:hypothetical protein
MKEMKKILSKENIIAVIVCGENGGNAIKYIWL